MESPTSLISEKREVGCIFRGLLNAYNYRYVRLLFTYGIKKPPKQEM